MLLPTGLGMTMLISKTFKLGRHPAFHPIAVAPHIIQVPKDDAIISIGARVYKFLCLGYAIITKLTNCMILGKKLYPIYLLKISEHRNLYTDN